MKWKSKLYYYPLMLLLCLCLVFTTFSMPTLASTASGSNDTWSMSAETFLYYAFNGFAKQISAPYVVYNTFADMGYDGFRLWCENGNHWTTIEDGTVVGHGGAGYSRDSDKIDNAENIEVPLDIKNLVLNYVQYNVTQNPLTYTQCYIPSYNFLNTSTFPTFQMYTAVKEYIKSQDGYTFISNIVVSYGNVSTVHLVTIPRNVASLGWVGTTNQGIFTSVYPYIDWQQITSNLVDTRGFKKVAINTAGTITTSNAGLSNNISYKNTNVSGTSISTGYPVFTNHDKNELVYVFNTLNAYKNYNSGTPQPYYITSTGANTGTWTASQGGVINTGTMNNSGNYYSQVTNGVSSNWTPDQIIQLVDTIVNSSGSNGGGSSSGGNSDNPFGFLGRLGELIGQLVGGVGDLLTGIVDGVVSIFLGQEDENGVRNGGLFGTIRDLLTQVSSIFDANIGQFISDVFGWLPSEIITLWTAGIFIAILFGILRIIRG